MAEEHPALYTITRTETGWVIRRYAARGAPPTSPETPASEARGERTPARRQGGGEVVHVRVRRGPGGEVQGKGTQDMTRVAQRNPRGEFREHRTQRRTRQRR